jgi:hypothetical protein
MKNFIQLRSVRTLVHWTRAEISTLQNQMRLECK